MSDGWMPGVIRMPTQSFWIGNEGFDAAVMHIAEDSNHSAEGYLAHTTDRSTHFYIEKSGKVVQYVSIHDSAWANGLEWIGGRWRSPEGHWVNPPWSRIRRGINPNRCTASVEHEGHWTEPWTPEMYQATVDVLCWIGEVKQVPIWLPGQNLIGHCDISPVDRPHCPGPHCDFAALAAAASAPAELHYVVVVDVVNIRQGPGRNFPIAGQIRRGDVIVADKIIAGEAINGNPNWVHIGPKDPTRANLGFASMALLRRV